MTSLACSALATIVPSAILRRGTHGCMAFSQHSPSHIVFPPTHTQCGASYRLYYALSKSRGIGASLQEQQDTGLCMWNIRCIVPMDPLSLLLFVDAVCLYLVWLGPKSSATVHFIVNSCGICGHFHLSVLIIGRSDLANCRGLGSSLSSPLQTSSLVSAVAVT